MASRGCRLAGCAGRVRALPQGVSRTQTARPTGRLPLSGGLTELCPAIGSGAVPKGHGGPTVTGDRGAMAALRGHGGPSGPGGREAMD